MSLTSLQHMGLQFYLHYQLPCLAWIKRHLQRRESYGCNHSMAGPFSMGVVMAADEVIRVLDTVHTIAGELPRIYTARESLH